MRKRNEHLAGDTSTVRAPTAGALVQGHTPGPWGLIAGTWWVGTPEGQPVCTIERALTPIEEAGANALLIAAAPETAAERDRLKAINDYLLASLEQIAYSDISADMRAKARAAIAKAGERDKGAG